MDVERCEESLLVSLALHEAFEVRETDVGVIEGGSIEGEGFEGNSEGRRRGRGGGRGGRGRRHDKVTLKFGKGWERRN